MHPMEKILTVDSEDGIGMTRVRVYSPTSTGQVVPILGRNSHRSYDCFRTTVVLWYFR